MQQQMTQQPYGNYVVHTCACVRACVCVCVCVLDIYVVCVCLYAHMARACRCITNKLNGVA